MTLLAAFLITRALVREDMRDAIDRREWARHREILKSANTDTRTGRNRADRAREVARIERRARWRDSPSRTLKVNLWGWTSQSRTGSDSVHS